MLSIRVVGFFLISILLFGCTKTTNPITSPSSSTPGGVTMSAMFSDVGQASRTIKGANTVASVTAGVDSIRIDSAIVVLAGIRFIRNIDSVSVDTADGIPTININDEDSSITFPGPFVIHVGDTNLVNFASKTLLAGTYQGIKFDVFKLGRGMRYWDSRRFNDSSLAVNDSAAMNYSIVVWGSVYKDTAWVPFEFKDDQNLEFKIADQFTISSPTSSVNIVLNFNMGSWFVNPVNGAILDPTNLSFRNYSAIRELIRLSLGKARCGRWDEFRRWGY